MRARIWQKPGLDNVSTEYAYDKSTNAIEEIACAENNRDFADGSRFSQIPVAPGPNFQNLEKGGDSLCPMQFLRETV